MLKNCVLYYNFSYFYVHYEVVLTMGLIKRSFNKIHRSQ